ncbi:MAG: KH domain-containing protein, partial [Nanoarchaeota archaeon]
TIFDEMRNTADFQLFADLRLAGIGLAGVVHATNPIDAIQRFVGRIELGVIPQIIDTVIFIKNGFVSKVLSLNMTVKVPEGMTEADLARPVVVVNDFETGKLEYELYSYGEETVVIPVSSLARSKSPVQKFAAAAIEDKLKEYVSNAKVEMVSDSKCIVYVPEREIARLIGKEGKNIAAIEDKLGVGIDVQPLSAKRAAAAAAGEGEEENIAFDAQIGKKHVVFTVDNIFANKNVKIYADDDYVMTANVGKDGLFKISRKNKIGNVISDAVSSGSGLKVTVSG